MFVVAPGDLQVSLPLLEEIKSYQIDLFSNLGLHFQYLLIFLIVELNKYHLVLTIQVF